MWKEHTLKYKCAPKWANSFKTPVKKGQINFVNIMCNVMLHSFEQISERFDSFVMVVTLRHFSNLKTTNLTRQKLWNVREYYIFVSYTVAQYIVSTNYVILK